MDDETPIRKRFDVPKPVSVGDIIDLTIESQGSRGDGIGKKDGFVIFVEGAAKGETFKVKITELRRTYAVGEKM